MPEIFKVWYLTLDWTCYMISNYRLRRDGPQTETARSSLYCFSPSQLKGDTLAEEQTMKKLSITVALILLTIASPVLASGGHNQGDNGQGGVHQHQNFNPEYPGNGIWHP